MTDEAIVLNETIHQSTRLRIMTLLVSLAEADRFAYGFIQQTLDLTGGNLTTHLRKLEDADYLLITKSSSTPNRVRGFRRHRWDARRSPNTSPTCTRR